MTIGFPLLLIPLAIYNIVVFLMPGVAFTAAIATVRLMSGAGWSVTFGDALLALGLLLLLFEVVKAARPGAKYLTDHLLSLVTFGGAVAEFLLLPQFATSTFFLLTAMMAVDFLAGAVNALRHRKYRTVDHHGMPRGDALERPIADEAPGSWGPEPLQRDPAKREVSLPAEPAPPTVSAPNDALSEVPPIEKIVPAVHDNPPQRQTDAQPSRKISEWSIADLVRDGDAGPAKSPGDKSSST